MSTQPVDGHFLNLFERGQKSDYFSIYQVLFWLNELS